MTISGSDLETVRSHWIIFTFLTSLKNESDTWLAEEHIRCGSRTKNGGKAQIVETFFTSKEDVGKDRRNGAGEAMSNQSSQGLKIQAEKLRTGATYKLSFW